MTHAPRIKPKNYHLPLQQFCGLEVHPQSLPLYPTDFTALATSVWEPSPASYYYVSIFAILLPSGRLKALHGSQASSARSWCSRGSSLQLDSRVRRIGAGHERAAKLKTTPAA